MSDIPTHENVQGIPHLSHVAKHIAPRLDCDVGLLIGRDCYDTMAPSGEIVKAPPGGAAAIETRLGWCIVGPDHEQYRDMTDEVGLSHVVHCTNEPNSSTSNLAICYNTNVVDITPSELMNQIDGKEFESPHSDASISQDDVKFLSILEQGTYQDKSGFYVMPLPFRENGKTLSSNYEPVLKRFHGLLAQFSRKGKDFETKYCEFMTGVIARGEAELVPQSDQKTGEGWYLPHHGVYHKKTGKLRVVYDCSSMYKGLSLNDQLLQGPDLNNSLLGVLLRFRQHPVALSCDIEKMYHRFQVVKEHRDYLKFFWLDDENNTVTYRMKVHIFGARSSPNCAKYGLHKLADDHGNEFPLAKQFIQHDFYVDDGVCSVKSSDEAIELLNQTKQLCSKGNLRVHKILSNQSCVLESLPPADNNLSAGTNIQLLDSTERALGMMWSLDSDSFMYSYQPAKEPFTRRSVLAKVASVYDPMGLVAPLILPARVLIQQSCKQGLSWDEEIVGLEREKWLTWNEQMANMSSIHIPRCVHPPDFVPVRQEIHTFADASELGYGACSYIRSFDEDDTAYCSLMLGKTRVAPFRKLVTIPRLELQAALLAAKQCKSLKSELGLDCQSYLWSDSRIVLGYINNESKRFHTYVANRLSQIHEVSSTTQWNHVATECNPADIVSRGLSNLNDLSKSIWFRGPEFLWSNEPLPTSPVTSFSVDPNDVELKKSVITLAACSEPALSAYDQIILGIVDKSSSWEKTARCISILEYIKSKHSLKSAGKISVSDRKSAENVIIRTVQNVSFHDEISSLRSGEADDKSSPLWKIRCYLDSDNILRVGGRLKHSSLELAEKHPVILPKLSNLSKQIIVHYHSKVAHQGRTSTMSAVRSAGYWIVGLSSLVSSIIYQCTMCRKLRRPCEAQKMADLPADRVEPAPPFTFVGCDVFGPFTVKEGRKSMKKYGLLFTCLSSRSIHIELLDDLSSDSFIQSWRCFVSLRGNVQVLRCDNGTNFKGACTEITNAMSEIFDDKTRNYLLSNQTEFRFNPPLASHMGGCWERMIRSVRAILNGLSPQMSNINTSMLRTLFYEAMAIVNSRPLTAVGPEMKPLSPNDILHMKSNVLLPMPGSFDSDDMYSRKRWRVVQSLLNNFWTRWKREYVNILQQRNKWQKHRRNLEVNDIVVLQDECNRMHWRLGKVIDAFKSADNLVRSVRVKVYDSTSNGFSYFVRPVTKLVCIVEARKA